MKYAENCEKVSQTLVNKSFSVEKFILLNEIIRSQLKKYIY